MKIDLRTIKEEARSEVQKQAAIVESLLGEYQAKQTSESWRTWTHADSELVDLVEDNRKRRG